MIKIWFFYFVQRNDKKQLEGAGRLEKLRKQGDAGCLQPERTGSLWDSLCRPVHFMTKTLRARSGSTNDFEKPLLTAVYFREKKGYNLHCVALTGLGLTSLLYYGVIESVGCIYPVKNCSWLYYIWIVYTLDA